MTTEYIIYPNTETMFKASLRHRSAHLDMVLTALQFLPIAKSQAEMKLEFAKAQAVTDTKIEALTSEVREHNNFAKRVPVLEAQVKRNTGDIAELSQYHKEPH